MYVFYNPKSLKIMAMSDQIDALEFPYLETNEFSFTSDCLQVVKKGKILKLEKSKRPLEPETFFIKEDAYATRKKNKANALKAAKDNIAKKLQNKSLKIEDLAEFITNNL